jgi:hypothetical protein
VVGSFDAGPWIVTGKPGFSAPFARLIACAWYVVFPATYFLDVMYAVCAPASITGVEVIPTVWPTSKQPMSLEFQGTPRLRVHSRWPSTASNP